MKSKLFFVIVLPILLGSIAASIYFSNTTFAAATENSSGEYKSFTLTASGQAYDIRHHEVVDVSLSIQGTVDGVKRNIIKFHVKGGEASAENYEAFSISKGYGFFVNKVRYVRMHLFAVRQYGGGRTVWSLHGRILKELPDNAYSITLYAHRVILPVDGNIKLTNLSLKGTVTLA